MSSTNSAMSPSLKYDCSKTGHLEIKGPVFLMMSRTNTTETMANISPFLIKKAIDGTCRPVLECKKLRSGQVLIKTRCSTQANKLTTLTGLSDTISGDITAHKTLNFTKGVIYCNDLRGISTEEIVMELKD